MKCNEAQNHLKKIERKFNTGITCYLNDWELSLAITYDHLAYNGKGQQF